MTTLIVATHPDDETLGCGGLIAVRAKQGRPAHVLVVTRGVPEIFPPEVIEETRRELARAHAILGVRSCTFLDFPAPRLDSVPGHEVADRISEVVRKLGAQEVLLPHRGDLHSDHRAVFLAGLVASRPVQGSLVKRVLCYETLSETDWAPPFVESAFVPNVFVDITTCLAVKIEAVRCYRTQLKAPPASRSVAAVEALAAIRGATVGVGAAEAFALVRDIE